MLRQHIKETCCLLHGQSAGHGMGHVGPETEAGFIGQILGTECDPIAGANGRTLGWRDTGVI